MADTVFSLILVPIRPGLRGFCLFILEIFLLTICKRNRSNTISAITISEMISIIIARLEKIKTLCYN